MALSSHCESRSSPVKEAQNSWTKLIALSAPSFVTLSDATQKTHLHIFCAVTATPLLWVLFEPVALDIEHLNKSQEFSSMKFARLSGDLVVDGNRFIAPHLKVAWPGHAENLAGHLRLYVICHTI